MATCKGRRKDGTPCQSPIVLDNGYCRAHQGQAPEAKAPEEPIYWTQERLEAAIAAHGGPEGLDLAGADLSDLDLRGMDLQGAYLKRVNLQGANLKLANLEGADLGGANLRGANLERADLQRANLGRANLQGARLVLANLQEATPVGANLREARLGEANLRGARLGQANLQGVNLGRANLQGANLRLSKLQEANLERADLQGADLGGADLQETNLRFANLKEVDMLDVKIGGLLGIKLYRAKLDHTALKGEQLRPAIGDEQGGEYREARDAYLALKQNFEGLGDYEAASWSYIKERQMEKACSAPWRARRFYGREQLKDTFEHKLPAYHPRMWWFFVRHTVKWLGDWFVEVLCGYGESIGRVLGWMAFLLFVAGPLLLGRPGLLDWPKANYDAFFSLPVPWRYGYAYLQQFLYVLDAFTTANFAELQPANSLGRLLSGFIALLGIFLTGLLGFVAGNRIRRS